MKIASMAPAAETGWPEYVKPVPSDELIEHLRGHPAVAMATMQRIAGDLRTTMLHVLDVAAGDAIGLVAKRLVQLVDDHRFEPFRTTARDRIVIEMPISQQELAAWAGVSHRSATGALGELRSRGLLTTRRLHIEVHDPAELEAIAGSG